MHHVLMRQLVIRYRRIEELVPYARNARTHSDAQVAEIAASILEYGWTNPVLCDEHGGIIAGHGRVLAARHLLSHQQAKLAEKGLDLTSLPTVELAGLTEAQRASYVLADNKLGLNAGWDQDMLAAELMRLQELGAPLALTGFSQAEADRIIAGWTQGPEDPGAEELDPDKYEFSHRCPKCGFEFNDAAESE